MKLYSHNIISTHGLLKLDENKIKYHMDKTCKSLINNSGINLDNLEKHNSNFVFYTDTNWNAHSCTYIHDSNSDNYYIVEPGYYYYITDKCKIIKEPQKILLKGKMLELT